MTEGDSPPKGPGIWIYLLPLFLLAAWPAVKWMKKANSGDLSLSNDAYTAFNSEEGELRAERGPGTGNPEFAEGIMGVRYRSKAGAAADQKAEAEDRAARRQAALEREAVRKREAGEKRTAAAAGKPPGRGVSADAGQFAANPLKAKEQQSVGFTRGLLTGAASRVFNNPRALGALFSNKYVVSGFMSRGTVKAATASPQALANYLKSGAPANFLNNPMVQAGMKNPAVISAMATSGLVAAMLETPAAKALMNDPRALGDLVSSNPELVGMFMSNTTAMNTMLANPDVMGLADKFDTSAVQQRFGGAAR